MKINGSVARGRMSYSLLLGVVLLAGQACQRETAEPATGAVAPANSLVALPSSVVVIARSNALEAYQADGNLLWKVVLPEGDQVMAAPVAALSSVAYVRGRDAIHAVSPTGQLLWRGTHLGGEDQIQGIVALNDSTVAISEEDRHVVAFTAEGTRRWTYTLPEGERLVAPPAVSANSLLLLRTATTLHAVDSGGNLAWTTPIEQSQP
jgi:outer membrane protein assembly factor BamB